MRREPAAGRPAYATVRISFLVIGGGGCEIRTREELPFLARQTDEVGAAEAESAIEAQITSGAPMSHS